MAGTDERAHVPDGAPVAEALARTTDLAVVAHPDDLELLLPGVIGACAVDPHRWFTGVVCTDGAGSVAPPDAPGLTGDALVAVRADEQRRAADLGSYAAVIQLGHPSGQVRDAGARGPLVEELANLLRRARPGALYTHDLADRHRTHVAVGLALVDAVRRLPAADRPEQLLGCEGWRSLDWLPDELLVRLDVSPHEDLADRLAATFASQLGAKRYDLAMAGRRRANATLADPVGADEARQQVLAMDLTALLRDDDLDPLGLVAAAVDGFRRRVEADVGGGPPEG